MAKESGELQQLQTQRQRVQEALDELDQQKSSLEEQLAHIRQQTTQETQLVSLSIFFFVEKKSFYQAKNVIHMFCFVFGAHSNQIMH